MVEGDYLDPEGCQVYPMTRYFPSSIKLPPIHLFYKVTDNFRRYNCRERLDRYNTYLVGIPLSSRYMKFALTWISVERDLIMGIEDLLGEDYYKESSKMRALMKINLGPKLYQELIQEAKRIKKSCMIIDYEMQ